MAQTLIIGGGIIGCSLALELARRDAAVTVIDRHGDVGHGSTSGSCGIVRRFYSTPTMTAMAQESANIWSEWADHLRTEPSSDLAHFERCGMLFIPTVIDGRVADVLSHMRDLGVAVELLDTKALGERFPFLDTGSHSPIRRPSDDDFLEPTGRAIAGAIFEPDAGYVVSPQLATANLRAACEREGVQFRLGQAVESIQKTDDEQARFRLKLGDGSELEGQVLVNVAGPHSGQINRMAGVELQLETRALRREVAALENPTFREGQGSATPIIGDLDSGVYLRPESRGREIVAGSLDPDCDELEWISDPDAMEDSISVDAFDRQVMRVMKRMPDVQLGRRRGIANLYDVTTLDWTPIIDRTDEPGYYVAIGTSGSSFKTAPVIGAMLAELIGECEGGRDHDLDPMPFKLPRTEFEVDCSFFSRLRAANASSNTVLG